MKIKINEDNRHKIEASIGRVMGKAKRFIHTSSDLKELAEEAEADLAKFGLAKSNRAGACLTARMRGPAKSYKYDAVASIVVIKRGPSGWFLVNVVRDEVSPAQGRLYDLVLEEEHVRAAVPTWKRCYGIQINWQGNEGQAGTV